MIACRGKEDTNCVKRRNVKIWITYVVYVLDNCRSLAIRKERARMLAEHICPLLDTADVWLLCCFSVCLAVVDQMVPDRSCVVEHEPHINEIKMQ